MQHHADLHPLAFVLEFENPQNSFVERSLGLHHVIVDVVRSGINRDSNREPGMPHRGPSRHHVARSKGTAIAKDMNGRLWQEIPAITQNQQEVPPTEEG